MRIDESLSSCIRQKHQKERKPTDYRLVISISMNSLKERISVTNRSVQNEFFQSRESYQILIQCNISA